MCPCLFPFAFLVTTPLNMSLFSADSLIEYGCVIHHELGFAVSKKEHASKLEVTKGIQPQSHNQLMTKDIILKANNKRVRSVEALASILSETSTKSLNRWFPWSHLHIPIEVKRKGKIETIPLTFAKKRDYSKPFVKGHF
ncbi:hypothetical protein GCM10023116_29320 [Kistimonas scapharcae]|uniref:PDZ domain-containing protein n=2 Tax=Kistimonas scapharcae TaxID=1036133 RepID=A0ABP8V3S1_9GAMM